LERQRRGLVYWHEQSGFNYDERAYYRGGRFYSEYNSDAYTNTDADTNCNSDAYTNTDADTDTNCNSDAYAYAYTNTDADTNCNSDADSYSCSAK
jgi:hypothetical protein